MALSTLRFRCRGHHNLRLSHGKTLEFTQETGVGPRATCVVGVAADFDAAEVARLRGRIRVRLRLEGAENLGESPESALEAELEAHVSPFVEARDRLVLRCSDELRGVTFASGASRGAAALDRRLALAMTREESRLVVEIQELGPVPLTEEFPGTLWLLAPTPIPSPRALRVLGAVDSVIWPRGGAPSPWREGAVGGGARGSDSRSALEGLRRGERWALWASPEQLGAGGGELVRQARAEGIYRATVGFGSAASSLLALTGEVAGALHAPIQDRAPLREASARAALRAAEGEAQVFQGLDRRSLRWCLESLASVPRGVEVLIQRDPEGPRERLLGGEPKTVLESLAELRAEDSESWGVALMAPSSLTLSTDSTVAGSPDGKSLAPVSGFPASESREGGAESQKEDDAAAALSPEERALLDALLQAGAVPTKVLAKALAAARGWPRRRAYEWLLQRSREGEEAE
ncbi:MAG: DUF371 domain-containing protein [Acidobacteriota bacterium]